MRIVIYSLLVLLFPILKQDVLAREPEKSRVGDSGGSFFPKPRERYYNVRMQTSSLGFGGILLRDTYLSPLAYGGYVLQYSQETSQQGYTYLPNEGSILQKLIKGRSRQANSYWLRQRDFVATLGQSKNPAGNGSISLLRVRLSGSLGYRISSAPWGRIYLGFGYTMGSSGLYSSRNGNNPASIKLDGALALAFNYSYRLPWRYFPALIRMSSRTNLLGTQWEQNFGESYYELYYLSNAVANRFRLAHLGNSLGQEFRFNLSLPLFDRVIYTLGYRYHHKSWRISGNLNRFDEHSFQLGITRYLRPLGGRSIVRNYTEALPF